MPQRMAWYGVVCTGALRLAVCLSCCCSCAHLVALAGHGGPEGDRGVDGTVCTSDQGLRSTGERG